MIQKTIITSDFHLLKTKINEWNNESEYARASSRVLLFSDQNDDPIHLRTQVGNIRSAFPDIEVKGITMPKKSMMQ